MCVIAHWKKPLAQVLIFRAMWQMSCIYLCTHAETWTECTGHNGILVSDTFVKWYIMTQLLSRALSLSKQNDVCKCRTLKAISLSIGFYQGEIR